VEPRKTSKESSKRQRKDHKKKNRRAEEEAGSGRNYEEIQGGETTGREEEEYEQNEGKESLYQQMMLWRQQAKAQCLIHLKQIRDLREELELVKGESRRRVEKVFEQTVNGFREYMNGYFEENSELKEHLRLLKEDNAQSSAVCSGLRAEIRMLKMKKTITTKKK
jgi:hypothetical protein